MQPDFDGRPLERRVASVGEVVQEGRVGDDRQLLLGPRQQPAHRSLAARLRMQQQIGIEYLCPQ